MRLDMAQSHAHEGRIAEHLSKSSRAIKDDKKYAGFVMCREGQLSEEADDALDRRKP